MRAWLIAVVLMVALAGCGDKDKAPDGGSYATPEQDEGAYVITVTSANALDPANSKVPQGEIVEWRVENGSGCRIKADDGSFDSLNGQGQSGVTYNNGIVRKGDAWRWFAEEAGTYAYGCAGLSIDGVLKVA